MLNAKHHPRRLALSSLIVLLAIAVAQAADEKPKAELGGEAEAAVQKAIEHLRAQGQTDEGAFTPKIGPGITAIVTAAVLRNGRTVDDPLVAKGLKYLEGFVQPNGGVYDPKSRIQNYETCLAVMCFSEANVKGRYDTILKNADKYLKGLQIDGAEGRKPSDVEYGGVGYGGAGRPDLSNTHFLMEALEAAGDGPDDEAVKRALIFVSRCQNLETEYNTTAFAAKDPDGGFYYTPAGGGSSPAGKTANGGLRSYGSMSYAGLKSMLFAGLTADDPRVKAALDWARKHYTLTENPGLGEAGLYYYYHLFAKALDATGQDTITDAEGNVHHWRQELAAELVRRQQPDGSWINKDSRWMEGDPNLVTGYALLTLSYCRPAAKK